MHDSKSSDTVELGGVACPTEQSMLHAVTFRGMALAAAVAGFHTPVACAQVSGHVVYSFATSADGSGPNGSLVADSAGRLYGATAEGGSMGFGTVFRLTPPALGVVPWTKEILHNFSGADGYLPMGPLLIGSSGDIYGETAQGGAGQGGVVFRLENAPGWPITILHAFSFAISGNVYSDAYAPTGGLQFGPGGLLYGVAAGGGGRVDTSGGVAFSLSPAGDATEYAFIHRFAQFKLYDGSEPASGLLPFGQSGFVGATVFGGVANVGTVFTLQLQASGKWTEQVIHDFGTSLDLTYPEGPLSRGRNGVIYGCMEYGGAGNFGGAYSLAPPGAAGGIWSETTLTEFGNTAQPFSYCSSIIEQRNGQLIGPAYRGGPYLGGGIFELTPPAAGQTGWTQTTLHAFTKANPAGYNPGGALLRRGADYFGANATGGAGYGTIFDFKP